MIHHVGMMTYDIERSKQWYMNMLNGKHVKTVTASSIGKILCFIKLPEGTMIELITDINKPEEQKDFADFIHHIAYYALPLKCATVIKQVLAIPELAATAIFYGQQDGNGMIEAIQFDDVTKDPHYMGKEVGFKYEADM